VPLRVLARSRPEGGPSSRPPTADGAALILAARRRALQVALGVIWLADAALQFQPYMFSRAFVSQVIAPAAAGNPPLVAGPISWSAGLIMRHLVSCNLVFATIQLLLGVGLLWRPAARAALAASIVWAAGVWWIGEGLGGVLTGTASPFTGAPGAAVLYVFLALLTWPPGPGRASATGSVATSGRLGATAPVAMWGLLWASLAATAIQPASRSPGGLAAVLTGMKAGEPGWIKAADSALADAVAGHGTQASITMAALCALAATAMALPRCSRLAVVTAAVVGMVLWFVEDFGEIFTGRATDPNSGLLLIVLAAAFWPLARPSQARPREPGTHPQSPGVVVAPDIADMRGTSLSTPEAVRSGESCQKPGGFPAGLCVVRIDGTLERRARSAVVSLQAELDPEAQRAVGGELGVAGVDGLLVGGLGARGVALPAQQPA
jgi:hypothetical protein